MSKHELVFEESLTETDFGLIVCGETGRLKGLWVPKKLDDRPVPENIIKMCTEIFGIDPSEFDDDIDNQMIH